MKNLKKLAKRTLKTIKGGINLPVIPDGCNLWNFNDKCCLEWDPEFSRNRICRKPDFNP